MKVQGFYVVYVDGFFEVRANRGATHIVMGKLISRDVAVELARTLAARNGVAYEGTQGIG